MRLIDADAFRHRMYHEVFEKDGEDQRWDSGCWIRYRLFDKVLEEQPTVEQPERKKGRWIPHEDEDGEHYGDKCSECGEWYVMPYEKTRFCPNCGADMREG